MNILRDIKLEDKEMIRQWRNMPEVAKYMYSDHNITLEEHENWFNRILKDKESHYFIIVSDEQDVGLVNLYNLDYEHKRCYWAFYLANPSVRGKGVGSFVEYSILKYVFQELKLNKLCAEVLDFNESVLNMHKSFGFKEEGILREHIKKDGKFYNVVSIAILCSEWELIKPSIEKRLFEKGII